ncbi:MAG: pentapeptide repeat-containing protein, partial [Phycisphaerales bacterium]
MFTGAKLHGANLHEARLDRADFRNAELHGADLRWSKLDSAIFSDATTVGADLTGADLTGANFDKVDLCGVKLAWVLAHNTRFRQGILRSADLSAAKLEFADFRAADLCMSKVVEAKLKMANLDNARLCRANVRRADLFQCSLCDADLRDVQYLHLDGNCIRGAQFSRNAGDPWSVLRRNYTGARFLFHLLFLSAFLLPYVARTAFWISANRAEDAATRANAELIVQLTQAAEQLRPDQPSVASALDALADRARATQEELKNKGTQWQVWQLLIGINAGWDFYVLSIALIVYNILRYLLTRRVTALREEEERSGYAPYWKEYGWLRWT